MFTGIVEEIGEVVCADMTSDGFALRIRADKTIEGSKPGDSIAVNGTCLTITHIDEDSFSFGVAPESLSRTNLGALTTGSTVNLERSVTPTTRMGGHFVQGHVDGVAQVASLERDGESLRVTLSASEEMLRGIVPKGFVAIDGISLTVVDVLADGFTVMLVPYTMEHVAPWFRDVGTNVNIELDILGKYVDRIVSARFGPGVTDSPDARSHTSVIRKVR